MLSFSSLRRSRDRVVLIAVVLLLPGVVGQEPRAVRAQTAVAAKLTKVLADVASVVPQDNPSSPPSATVAAIDTATLPKSAQDALKGRSLRLDAAGRVQVYVLVSNVTVPAIQQLTAAGVTIEILDAPHHRVQAAVPLSRLEAVTALPFVNFIRLPSYAIRRKAESEGDAIIQATAARSQYSLDGSGVNVAAISDGLKGVFATGCTSCQGVSGGPISTGDLPSATGTRTAAGMLTTASGGINAKSFTENGDLEGLIPGCAFAGAGAEGTALLEIVHDVAPNAQLAFANADTDLAFNNAVNFLDQGNDVVVDDLGFFDVPLDGTNLVSANTAAALNNNANRVVAHITANGNEANDNYFGPYVDSGVDGRTITGITNAGDLHLFRATPSTVDVLGQGPRTGNAISLPAGGEVQIFLAWNDPAGASTNNYDLYLVQQSTNTVVASSTDVQNGSIDPTQFIDYVNNGAAGLFTMVIQNVNNRAAPKNLQLISFQPECAASGPQLLTNNSQDLQNFNTASSSMLAESDAGGSPAAVISVGAICSASSASVSAFAGGPPDLSCEDSTHSTAEFFSSQGPTWDGRTKPDIAAIDGVTVSGAGSFQVPFFGTSATGPHIAGEAALVLQAAPCLQSTSSFALDPASRRIALRNALTSSATPKSASPPDNVFGAGLADALKAVQSTLPNLAGPAGVVVSANVAAGAQITGTQLGFADPNRCSINKLSWTGGCGTSPNSAMTCPVGTTSVSVAASNGGTAFSAPSSLQVTVSGFSISAATPSMSAPAGQSVKYQLAIAPSGGPYGSPVTLGCSGLPQGAACTFSPSAVTPANASAASTLTITTTGAAASPLAGAVTGLLQRPAAPRPFQARGKLSRLRLALLGLLLAVMLAAWLVGVIGVLRLADRHRFDSIASSVPRAWMAGAMMAAALAMALQVACGSGGSNSGGSTPSTVSVSPTSLSFGTQSTGTATPPQAVTVLNTGTSALSISSITSSGDFATTNNCGSSLAAGLSCSATVTFRPTASGARTGTLSLNDAAGTQTVSLTGTGTSSTGTTPAGTYQVTVTGFFGTFVQTATITLIVQ